MDDNTYGQSRFRAVEIEHGWGPNVHLLDQPLMWSWLARLSAEGTSQPEITRLMKKLYTHLAWTVAGAELVQETVKVETRMHGAHPGVTLNTVVPSKAQRAVTVAIARAGNVPSQVLFEVLNEALDPELVQQDHLVMARTTDAENQVTGTELMTAKAGANVDGATVFFPDPMGATGSSICRALDHYRDEVAGTPAKRIAMHLIVTPEYLRKLQSEHPNVIVYALRYDRGLSSEDALQAVPGTHPGEKGLNEQSYIVPGAGGLGELMNNVWV